MVLIETKVYSKKEIYAYSPLKVLSRGYSISKIEDKVIKHVKDVASDDIMVTRVNDGVITSCVVSTKEE